MNKLEQLLNSLIEKGWKPFGHEYVSVEHLEELVRFYYEDKKSCIETLRIITCKESGLWQFVCENGMIPKENHERVYDVFWGGYGVNCKAQIISREPEYWFIESALKDESELEDFLLSNIKIEGKNE